MERNPYGKLYQDGRWIPEAAMYECLRQIARADLDSAESLREYAREILETVDEAQTVSS